MMKATLLGLPDLHGLTAGVDEHTQELEEHEESKNTRTQTRYKDTFPSPVGPSRSNRIPKGEIGK